MKKDKTVNKELITERNNKIKETLESLIFPVILTLIIGAGVFFVINYQNIEEPEEIIEVRSFAGDETPLL